MLVMAWPMSGRMGFSLFPRLEGEFVVATVELPSNAPLSQARDVRQFVEQKLRLVTDPYESSKGQPLVTSVQGNIDGTKRRRCRGRPGPKNAACRPTTL